MKARETIILSCILLSSLMLATQVFEKPKPVTYELRYACNPADGATASFPFCNTSLPDADRVTDLISRLTVAEKLAQLVSTAANVSRLGLPAYQWWGEGLHGVAVSPSVHFGGDVPKATSFPLPIVTAASFNKSLWNQIAQVTSTEGRAFYNQGRSGLTYWSPNINVARDPRWGRTQETPGEDPRLAGVYAVHFVKGLQEGDMDSGPANPRKRLKISACCKHFTAHDLDRWKNFDRDHFDAKVTEQDMEDTYNPPFKSCVKGGQSSSLMCSYNRVNGIPMCANYELLTLTVRNQWGFDGYIMSDCDAVSLIHDDVHYARTPEDAVSDVMLAGMDLNCGTTTLLHGLSALRKKLIWEGLIDQHLRNVFSVRMRLGMFDGPPTGLSYGLLGPADVCTEENQELALEAARESLVLLKNEEKGGLPWKLTEGMKLAVVGPHANATREMLGNYQGLPCKFTTTLESIKTLLAPHGAKITHSPGCYDASCDGMHLIHAARRAVAAADATVLVLGLSQRQEKEGHDRLSLLLPGHQNALLSAVADAAKGPITLVILSGGPVDISFAKNHPAIQSIIWAGYPGEAGGQAIAEAVFGAVNPSGRLVQSWYYENYTRVDMADMNMRPNATRGYPGRTYRFFNEDVVWEFGHGLGYSNFTYRFVDDTVLSLVAPPERHQLCASDRALVKSKVKCLDAEKGACKASSFEVRVAVRNTGPMSGGHSVLLFVKSPASGVDGTPLKQLVSFERVHLEPGEEQEVVFKVNPCEDLGTVGSDGIRTVSLGEHTLIVGTEHHTLTVDKEILRQGEL